MWRRLSNAARQGLHEIVSAGVWKRTANVPRGSAPATPRRREAKRAGDSGTGCENGSKTGGAGTGEIGVFSCTEDVRERTHVSVSGDEVGDAVAEGIGGRKGVVSPPDQRADGGKLGQDGADQTTS